MIHRILLSAALIVALAISAHALTPTYSLTALPPVAPGGGKLYPTSINNQGTVIELFTPSGADYWASCEYAHGQFTFPKPPTEQNYLNAINNFGEVVGVTSNGQPGFAFLNGKTITIEPSPGALAVVPTGINDLGQIVGNVSPAGISINTNDHIFLRQPKGAYVDLGTFGGYPLALINNQGMIVIGVHLISVNGVGSNIAYIRQPGSANLQQIPPLVPGDSIAVLSLNNLGVVSGTEDPPTFTETETEHAILYANGKTSDLGTLPPVGPNPGVLSSGAECINTWGQIVGYATQGETYKDGTLNPGYQHGFIYYDGVMRDLNAMLPASANGWVITEALSINDWGQILCSASYQGQGALPVILTPNAILP